LLRRFATRNDGISFRDCNHAVKSAPVLWGAFAFIKRGSLPKTVIRPPGTQPKPADAQAAVPAPAAPAAVEAKPAPQIQPTQAMPKAQGLD